MLENVIGIDTDLFLWLNSYHNSYWDIFMKMVSAKFTWVVMYVIIILALWKAYGWRSMLIVAIGTMIAVALADQATASLLRPFFERLRPAHIDNPISPFVHIVDGSRGGAYGFPSSHAANTFATATLLSLVFRRWQFTVAIFIWAILNCYSRIYLGMHYPGDLIAGILIGFLFGLILYFIVTIINNSLRWCHHLGKRDPLLTGYIGGIRIRYRAYQLVIFFEFLTFIAILLYSFNN